MRLSPCQAGADARRQLPYTAAPSLCVDGAAKTIQVRQSQEDYSSINYK
jgi:hypothetical protein